MFDMFGNVIFNLFSPPATRKYPKSKKIAFDRSIGKTGMNIEECTFCKNCRKHSPADPILVESAKFETSAQGGPAAKKKDQTSKIQDRSLVKRKRKASGSKKNDR